MGEGAGVRARPPLEPQRGRLRLATVAVVLTTSETHAAAIARGDNSTKGKNWQGDA